MVSQDLIYSVLPRPLGNQVSAVKSDVKEVSKTARLKPIEEDEKATEQYGVREKRVNTGDRRKNRKERRKLKDRRSNDTKTDTRVENQPNTEQDKKEGGLDLYV